MRKAGAPQLLLAGLLVVAAALVWIDPFGDPRQSSAPTREQTESPEQVDVDFDSSTSSATRVEHPESGSQGESNHQPLRRSIRPADALAGVVRGQCVDPLGRPVRGVRVEIMSSYGGKGPVRPNGSEEGWQTDDEGWFEASFEPDRLRVHDVTLSHPDFVPLTDLYVRVGPGESHELGTVEMVTGRRIVGRLVDRGGLDVPPLRTPASVRLGVQREGPLDTGFRPRDFVVLEVDRSGRFESASAFPFGDYRAEATGFELVHPDATHRFAESSSGVDLVVYRADELLTVRGFVVDEHGRGLSHATLRFRAEPSFYRTNARTRSDEQGAFEMTIRPDRDIAAARDFRFFTERPGYVSALSDTVHNWGDEHVRLILHSLPKTRLILRSGIDGRPVTRASVLPAARGVFGGDGQVAVLNHTFFLDADRDGTQDIPGGVLELDRLNEGIHLFRVIPPPETGLSTDWFEVEVSLEGASEFVLTLPPAAEQSVIVRGPDGSPVADAEVALIAPGRIVDPDSDRTRVNPIRLLHSVTTDASGRATVRGSADRDLTIRVTPPGTSPASVDEAAVLVHGVRIGEAPVEVELR